MNTPKFPLFSHPEALPLWPDGPMPGAAPGADASADDPRARYRPCLLPRLLSDAGGPPRPLVIICPGGGYAQHSPRATLPVADWLNGLGLHAAVLGYRLAPHRFPAPLLDVQRAIRVVRQQAPTWRVDPQRVAVIGFSAGGHVAGMAATLHGEDYGHPADALADLSMRPDLLIASYAVLSLVDHPHVGSRTNLLGADADAGLAERLSIERRVGPDTPPTFLWHTADDPDVAVENSLHLALALRAQRVPCALHVFPHGPHALVLAEGHPAAAWTGLAAQWLAEQGWC